MNIPTERRLNLLYISSQKMQLPSTTERLAHDLESYVPHSNHTPVDGRYRARHYSTFDPYIPDLPSPSFIPSPLIFLVHLLINLQVIEVTTRIVAIWQRNRFIIPGYVVQVAIYFNRDYTFFSPLRHRLHCPLYPISLSISGSKFQT